MKLIDYFIKLSKAANALGIMMVGESIECGDIEVENEFQLSFISKGFRFSFDRNEPERRIYLLQYSDTTNNLSGDIQFVASSVFVGDIIGLFAYVGMYKLAVKYLFHLINTYGEFCVYLTAVTDICVHNYPELLEAILDKDSLYKAFNEFMEYDPKTKSGTCLKPRLYLTENNIYDIMKEYSESVECISILLRYKEKWYGSTKEDISL